MFNTMKNHVREKTGRDLPKFTAQKGGLSRHSRQGSESSLSSLVLEPTTSPPAGPPPSSPATLPITSSEHQIKLADGKVLTTKEVNVLAKKEEEWRNRLEKKEAEWTKKMEKRETELLSDISQKELEWINKEAKLTEDLLKQTNELKEVLKVAEDYKKKVVQFQEEKDQLDSFQTQEMSKIKHLLLAKEKENSEMAQSNKEMSSLVESLRAEVNRLRPFEEKISNCELGGRGSDGGFEECPKDDLEMLRHTSERERWQLSSKLAQSEEQVRHLTDRVTVLTKRSESDSANSSSMAPDERVQVLLGERALLERRLEEAHVHLSDIKASWSAKISSLETQVERLSRQAGEEGAERRRADNKVTELEAKLDEEIKEKEKLATKVERLSDERDSLAQEIKSLTSQHDSLKEANAELQYKLSVLETEQGGYKEEMAALKVSSSEHLSELAELKQENTKLATELKAERERNEVLLSLEKGKIDELCHELESEKKAKDDALLRNAQVSQQIDITKQELSQLQVETEDVFKRASLLEEEAKVKDEEIRSSKSAVNELSEQVAKLTKELEKKEDNEQIQRELNEKVNELESQVAEKNKTIKILQQLTADLKKTLQRELKAADPGGGGENNSSNYIHQHNNSRRSPLPPSKDSDEDVNFLYLKHVIMKFLTSREYEAQHLTRAVATLLKLTPEEESLLKDTLDWKMSWFKSKPKPENYSLS